MANRRPVVVFLILVLILLTLGVMMVYSSSYPFAIKYAERYNNDPNYFGKRQFIFVIIGLIGMLIAYKLPINFFRYASPAILLISMFMCALTFTLFKDQAVNDVYRWLRIGPVSFQPSDFLKLGVGLFFPAVLSRKRITGQTRAIILFIIALTAGVVYLQKDLGTVVVILGVIFILYFITHMTMAEFLLYATGGVLFLVYAISGTQYRRNRWNAFRDPFSDRLDTGWHAIQSMYAVANGGFGGVGIGNSIQKHGYVYAAYSDYIFSIISEELGMFGGMLVIFAILGIVLIPVFFSRKLEDKYERLVLIAFSLFVFIQSFIHIAVVLNAIPAKGITLPFISYGGSSIITYCGFAGVALNIMSKGKLKVQRK